MKLKILLPFLFISSASAQITTDALLDTIQHTAFNFFWNEANPANGLIRDRANANGGSSAACSIASVGFGLSAICIGVDHGWVSREAARDRVLTTLKTFWYSPQGDGSSGYIGNFGLFYHFLDMNTATRDGDTELSTIDTALLLAGIIDAKQYFSGSDSSETLIRQLADSIYYRMDWNLMRNYNPGILMAWKPGTGFSGYGQWVGYNEASIMYVLALGSPSHPVDYYAWQEWTSGYQYGSEYGYSYVIFPPLFGHQYSQCWIDYRNIADDYMKNRNLNYFENSRRAALAQRAYAVANPGGFAGYSDSLWGFTASDTPYGYKARGAPPAQNDDGTITPTAPVSSIVFAPDEVVPVIKNMWNNYNTQLWTKYGFRD
ncbi:MAG: Tat pathway signal protein, partial [Bacteroidota bacterium]|nr:Tat pathway signal protein [Bacteroidota bacterium]